MEIRDLSDTSSARVVDCLNAAFSNYFVKLPTAVDYWTTRFKSARVDFSASCGCFDAEELVGFIINGIDSHEGKLTAFNSGTGVLEQYRGQSLVDRMYEFLLPRLRERGVQQCMLEVIRENEKAVRVYERIGFRKKRSLLSFSGVLKKGSGDMIPEEESFRSVLPLQTCGHLYSWDNSNPAIESSGGRFRTFLVWDSDGREAGYFTIDPQTGYLPQVEAVQGDYHKVLDAISLIAREVRINNIDETRTSLIAALQDCGLTFTVGQFEMEMSI